jgi:hypothetical protein
MVYLWCIFGLRRKPLFESLPGGEFTPGWDVGSSAQLLVSMVCLVLASVGRYDMLFGQRVKPECFSMSFPLINHNIAAKETSNEGD